MAEGWLRHFGVGKLEVYSAGTRPCFVNPFAIAVMKEVGVDISSHRSKSVNELVEVQFDYVITVCNNAREECPYLPGANVLLHMPFDDPSFFDATEEEQLNEFRRVREVIRAEMEGFAESLTKE